MSLVDIANTYGRNGKRSSSPIIPGSDVFMSNLQWDLDRNFIGQPLDNRTMARLSAFVDNRLTEYARIMGSTPVVRPLGRLNIEGAALSAEYQDEEDRIHLTPPARGRNVMTTPVYGVRVENNQVPSRVQAFPPTRTDEHVCHDGEEDGFVMMPPQETRGSRPDQDRAVTAAITEAQRFINPPIPPENISEAVVESQRVKRFREGDTESIRTEFSSQGTHWRRSETPAIQDVPHPPEYNHYDRTDHQRFVRTGNQDIPGVQGVLQPPQRWGSIEANGDRVEMTSGFLNTETGETGSLSARVRRDHPQEDEFDRVLRAPIRQVEEPIYTSGLIYEARNRVRDTFARYPQTSLDNSYPQISLGDSPSTRVEGRFHRDSENRVQASRVDIPSTYERQLRLRQDNSNDSHTVSDFRNVGDTLTYVTSYDINYTLGTVKAKVLVAPHGRIITHEEWFGYNMDCPGSMQEAIHQAIQANLTIKVKNVHHNCIPYSNEPLPERVALDTLREMISEMDFRRYLKKGYALARGKSGRIYQVYRSGHTKVYENGKMIEELCMYLHNAPPTDSVIAKLVMIDCNEDDLKKSSNVYNMRNDSTGLRMVA